MASSKQALVSNPTETVPRSVSAKSRTSLSVTTSHLPKRSSKEPSFSMNEKLKKSPKRKSFLPVIEKFKKSPSKLSKVPTPTLKINHPKLKSPRRSLSKRKSISLQSCAAKNSTASIQFLQPSLIHKCNICQKTFRLRTTLISHQKSHQENTNKCQFCDKKFAIKSALETHLKDNCKKISFTERKKLLNNSINRPLKSHASNNSPLNSVTSKSSLDVSSSSDRSMRNTAHYGVYRTPSKPITCNICKINLPDILKFTSHVEMHSKNGKKIEFMDEK